MNLSLLSQTNNGQQNFRLGLIHANPVVVVIATQDLHEQSRYTVQALGTNAPDGAVNWIGTFSAPSGARTDSFAGPAQYQSLMTGRYQYILNAGGHPIIVTLNVGWLNRGLIPPTGTLRLLQ